MSRKFSYLKIQLKLFYYVRKYKADKRDMKLARLCRIKKKKLHSSEVIMQKIFHHTTQCNNPKQVFQRHRYI